MSQPSRLNWRRADWILARSNMLRGIVLETNGAGVHLAASGDDQRAVEVGPAGFDPADAGAAVAEGSVEIGHDHVVADSLGFADDAAVTVDDHGVAGADFVVILADAIGKNEEHAVVVGPRRQPTHQP